MGHNCFPQRTHRVIRIFVYFQYDPESMKVRKEYWVSQTHWRSLDPFEKHSYPSYPDTEKKKKNRSPFKVV